MPPAEPVAAHPPTVSTQPSAEPPPAPIPETVEGLITSLPQRFRPERAEGVTTTLHFLLSDDARPEWTVRVADGACTVSEGLKGTPDCVVRMSGDTYVGIETGRVNPQVAFMMGKVKVSDIGQMMQYIKLFRAAR